MLLKDKIKLELQKAIDKLYPEVHVEEIDVGYPDNISFGDYFSTVPFKVLRALKESGKKVSLPEISNNIVAVLNRSFLEEFAEIYVANGGFINFRISDKYLIKLIEEVSVNENFGVSDYGSGKGKIIIEYVSANPTGPLHIGHGRWAALGDSLYRAFKCTGYDVYAEFYINDAGNQVRLLRESVRAVKEGKDIPEDGYHGEYIRELANYDEDPVVIILKLQKEDLDLFRVNFDNWFSEKSLHDSGYVEETLSILKDKGYVYEKDGALWFKSSEFGDDKDRVVKKSTGEYTYFGVDIAYHRNKIERGFKKIINIWGADHHGYVKRLRSAVKIFSDEVDFSVVLGQLVSLYRNGEPVRMSKRTGDMITLREVIEEVGVDATRYFLVSKKSDTHLDFDLELAKKQTDENPVFYLQYAHARISGIIKNVEQIQKIDYSDINIDEARDISRYILRFPEEIVDITISLDPQRMTTYLFELASMFHSFYNKYRVIYDEKCNLGRLKIVKAVKNVIKKGLWILGISAPDSM